MGKRDELEKRRRKIEQFKRERELESSRENFGELRKYIKEVGCDLPFYELADSYKDAFEDHLQLGPKKFATLQSINLVSEYQYDDETWSLPVDASWNLIRLNDESADETYSKSTSKAKRGNLRGYCSFYETPQKQTKSVIVLVDQRNLESDESTIYSRMLISLLHEFGHIYDSEHAIHLDPSCNRFDLVQSEAFANCYALDCLADLGMRISYNSLFQTLSEIAVLPGSIGDIGRVVMEKHVRRVVPNWLDFIPRALARKEMRNSII